MIFLENLESLNRESSVHSQLLKVLKYKGADSTHGMDCLFSLSLSNQTDRCFH